MKHHLALTTALNAKIVCVVLVLVLAVMGYSHWLYLQEENEKNSQWMAAITEFLARKEVSDLLAEGLRNEDADKPLKQQVCSLSRLLQPAMTELVMPVNHIKYGIYSRRHASIVAIGPQPDVSMLLSVDPERFKYIYETNNDQFRTNSSSLIWHGASSISHIRPIEKDGVLLGHAFASINQDATYAVIWRRTLNTFLGSFLMLLVCVAIFRELFVKLKNDLRLFAEAILDERANDFHSEIAEFTPVLNYINEQTKKMTKLDRLNIIGEMAASIAHEVRNPMTTVRGLLQFIGNKPEFSRQKPNFDLMIDEIDRANCIISEFLALAKNNVMEFTAHNLNDIISGICPLLQADALRHGSEVRLVLGAIPPVSVDQSSIRQLILNMVRNGLDAMPDGGTVSIITETDGAKVWLSIKDEGVGIDPEIKDKLGTPFFTTKESGTGLGLAVCYRVVHRHGATLTVESEPGQGTVFSVGFDPLGTTD
ncbi:MAG: ATP-binding protein [Sporomusaceae bacterium]|nr:ATP-binding protein [Sporomusaceae bacterium]